MKAVVYNLGCKVNKYECDCLIGKLRAKGYDVSEKLERADIYIINTCAVTAEAERKSRQCVGRCLKLNGDARVIVTGCASQDDAAPFASSPRVSYVCGTAGKADIADKLDAIGVDVIDLPLEYEELGNPETDRTRMSVKIQDGCDNYCSYCLIPYLRGRSRSRSEDAIVAECMSLSRKTCEIVLTGIDISSYGKNTGSSLAALLTKLKDVDCRIRLGSLEASVITHELLEACKALPRFCPQFHLSLQSGCDSVLKRMNRHYTANEYADKVRLIRSYFPCAAITTDLICGFPAESEEDFEQSIAFIDAIGFSHVHVFGYSPRKGTAAAKLKPLHGNVIKDRCMRAQSIAKACSDRYLESLKGKVLEVLTESVEGEYTCGFSREYVRCYISGAPQGSIVKAKATELFGEGLLCEIIG